MARILAIVIYSMAAKCLNVTDRRNVADVYWREAKSADVKAGCKPVNVKMANGYS